MDAKTQTWMPTYIYIYINGCQQMDANQLDANKGMQGCQHKWMPTKWMPTNGCQINWMPTNGCKDDNKIDVNKMDANKMNANKWMPTNLMKTHGCNGCQQNGCQQNGCQQYCHVFHKPHWMPTIYIWMHMMPYIYILHAYTYMDCTTIMDANYNHMHNQLDTQQMKCKDSQQYTGCLQYTGCQQMDANHIGCQL